MDILAACLSGIMVKVYDDLTDNNIIQDGFIKECLHTLSCFLLAASSTNDFTYVCLTFFVHIVNDYVDKKAFSELKEKSILYMFPLFFLISLPSMRMLTYAELCYFILSIFIMFKENDTITEEVSFRKLSFRLFIAGLLVLAIFLLSIFNLLTTSLMKICLYFIFIALTSSVYQSYKLLKDNDLVKQYTASNII